MRKCLEAYRTEQLLKIKAEIAQTYTILRELQRQEILLTPVDEAHSTRPGSEKAQSSAPPFWDMGDCQIPLP